MQPKPNDDTAKSPVASEKAQQAEISAEAADKESDSISVVAPITNPATGVNIFQDAGKPEINIASIDADSAVNAKQGDDQDF